MHRCPINSYTFRSHSEKAYLPEIYAGYVSFITLHKFLRQKCLVFQFLLPGMHMFRCVFSFKSFLFCCSRPGQLSVLSQQTWSALCSAAAVVASSLSCRSRRGQLSVLPQQTWPALFCCSRRGQLSILPQQTWPALCSAAADLANSLFCRSRPGQLSVLLQQT